jgi:hypothetical protein
MAPSSNSNGSIMDKPCPIGPIPVPGADRKPTNTREYLQYVNQTEPGGFRALRKRILSKDKNGWEDINMGGAEDDEEKAEPEKNPIEVYRDVSTQVA